MKAAQLLSQGRFAIGESLGLARKFFLHPRLHLAHEGKGVDEELPKALAHALLQQIPTQGLRCLLLLEALEGRLENSGKLRSWGHLVIPRSALPTAFEREERRR